MKLPITKYGLPQAVTYPLAILIVMGLVWLLLFVLPVPAVLVIQALLLVLFVWMLCFFRDPHRDCPKDESLILSPADGKVTQIDKLPAADSPLGAETLRISIFLSIFNVHINRMPCAVEVLDVTYRPGKYKNAMNPESSRVNESNDLLLRRMCEPPDTLMVRQISGAIARRIVCRAQAGKKFSSGRRFGMIKFGSRTELYLTERTGLELSVKVGDSVKAGLTICARYRDAQRSQ